MALVVDPWTPPRLVLIEATVVRRTAQANLTAAALTTTITQMVPFIQRLFRSQRFWR
jgi:hypothetical protein